MPKTPEDSKKKSSKPHKPQTPKTPLPTRPGAPAVTPPRTPAPGPGPQQAPGKKPPPPPTSSKPPSVPPPTPKPSAPPPSESSSQKSPIQSSDSKPESSKSVETLTSLQNKNENKGEDKRKSETKSDKSPKEGAKSEIKSQSDSDKSRKRETKDLPAPSKSLSECPDHSDPKALIGFTLRLKYKITKVLGSGSFGVCYEAIDRTTDKRVAIKLAHEETYKNHRDMIDIELAAHQIMNNTKGIPKLFDNFVEKYREMEKEEDSEKYVIVMEMLGPDLDKLYDKKKKNFSFKTIFMIGYEMISRLKSVHEKGLIHRDIKPENYLIGPEGEGQKLIYLTDFGLTKRYWDDLNGVHTAPEQTTGLTGTVRYVSVNVHKAMSMSRRDDLESVAYILMYFIAGGLPWDGWQTRVDDSFYSSVRAKKESIEKKKFFAAMPEVIQQFLQYCRQLSYEQTPDYDQWLNKFKEQSKQYNFEWDYKYDWVSDQSNSSVPSTV